MNRASVHIAAFSLCLIVADLGIPSAAGQTTPCLSLDIRQFGAQMDGRTDDTEAFERAFAAAADGAAVTISAGTAILSRQIRVAEKSLTIRGTGMFSARLRWITKGGFDFSDARTWTETKGMVASWEITGLCFEAGAPDAGTALQMAPQGARLSPSVIVRDCRFEPAPGAPGAYWTKSIAVRGGHLGQITGCYFRGAPSPDGATSHHIHLSGNSTTFMIENCHGSHSLYGVLVEGETEGTVISKCFFVNNAYGYALSIAKGGEPMFSVFQSHAASCVHPLWIRNGRSSSITGNLFVLRGDGYAKFRDPQSPPAIVRIEGTAIKDVILSGNTLEMNDRALTGPFIGVDVVQGRGVMITDNTIANNFSASGETGIRIGAGVRESLVADNICHLSGKSSDIALSSEAIGVSVRHYDGKQ